MDVEVDYRYYGQYLVDLLLSTSIIIILRIMSLSSFYILAICITILK